MRQRALVFRTFTYIFLIISSFIMAYPVLYMALGAFTTNERFFEATFLPIPNTLNLNIFKLALTSGGWDAYVFTLVRVAFYEIVTVGVGLIGGYIFSKMNFPGKSKVFLLFLSGMVMPAIIMLLPSYLMMARWPLAGGNDIWGQGGHGWMGQWPVLFIGGWVPVFAIFLLKQSFDMLPSEYEDAAKMDGAGFFTIIFRVYGPLLKPPLVVLIVGTFIGVWGDYLWPSLTVAGHQELYPIAMRIQYLILEDGPPLAAGVYYNYPPEMVRAFMAMWPPALVYFLLQRYFVQGLVAAGIKG